MTRDPIFEIDDITTVNIGCTLAYHVVQSTPALFLIRPHMESGCVLLEEGVAASTGVAMERISDQFGNQALKTLLMPGYNEFRYEATLEVPQMGYERVTLPHSVSAGDIPIEVWRYTLPSRYCESDRLHSFARQKFGHLQPGHAQAQAICDWVHDHLEYRYGSGDSTLSACDAMRRGYGVCRDFAHVMIALCRALDLPARYVAGHIPVMQGNEVEGDNDIGIDFHAYAEVYFDGCWHTFDARYNQLLKGRIKVAHGMDAVDAAFATFYGNVDVLKFEVWARQIEIPFAGNELPPQGKGSWYQHTA